MAKVKGSYKSLVRGVSEQVPHDRLDGQHFEQVNLVSDPIRGLVRRRGSQFRDSSFIGPVGADQYLLKGYREYSFTANAQDFSVLYQTEANGVDGVPPILIYNKDTNKIVPLELGTTAESRSLAYGLSSAVSVGRYLLLSVNGHTPIYTEENKVASSSVNAVIWVRGGAYSRTYALRIGDLTIEYTTPQSYYDGVLDTSDISYSEDDYQKQVNDRVNDYNTAVNQYIATAQEAIQPENIAEELRALLVQEGYTVVRQDSHLLIQGLDGTETVTGSDGGDGGFLRVTHRNVGGLDDLTKQHVVGTVIAVEVSDDDVYYVEAFPKEGSGTSVLQDVIWRESSGYSVEVEDVFLIGTEYDGTFYVASSPANLLSLLPPESGLEVPQFVGRHSGDETTNPKPDFFSRPISYLGVLQDRLVICSGANVFMSVPGDYFNWFRKSALRINDDDPIEVYALGAEDDTIRGGTLIDRNLILTGDSYHYAVSGRDAITPNNAIVSVQAAHEATTDAAPKPLGNLLFFGQHQGGVTKLHQMQTGAFSDSFVSFSVTQQITEYIKGRPRQLVASSQPNMILLSTDDNTNGVYAFTFLDSPGQEQRLFDSWSRWEWDPALGKLIGMTNSDEGFIVFLLRECDDGWHIVADELSRDSALDDMPYLDTLVPYTEMANWPRPIGSGTCSAALPATHERRLFGKPLDDVDSLLALSDVEPSDIYVGVNYLSYYEPTPPYPRDRESNAILTGRTVLASLGFTLAQSAGMEVWLAMRGGDFDQRIFSDAGFRIHDPLSPLGAVPLTDRRVSCYVGREIREHRLRVQSRTWTPLNIATVEWTIQTFSRRR